MHVLVEVFTQSTKEFKKGDEVEALWHGSYWKAGERMGKGVGILSCYLWDVIACCMSLVVAEAEVVRVHRNGSYDIKWKAPYHLWPPEIGAASDRLRKCES